MRELGTDPVAGATVLLKDGRFGPYVTDGTTNASLRREDDPLTITPERAYELLADRRAKGPAKKPAKKKTSAKKTTSGKASGAKKASAKTNDTKKTSAKTSSTKKTTQEAGAKKAASGKK